MTSETLRKACGLAGLERFNWRDSAHAHGVHAEWCIRAPSGIALFSYLEEDPALLPLVAERLLIQCLRRHHFTDYHSLMQHRYGLLCKGADAEKRILALMEVLGELTIEKAQAELEGG